MTIKVCSLLKASPKRVTAKEPSGRSLKADQLLPALEAALTTLLGPFKTQRFLTKPSKFSNTVLAGKLGLGAKVYALMHELDFTPIRSDIAGAYGGFRQELNSKSTTVNYCSRSGVLVVTTNVDAIDV